MKGNLLKFLICVFALSIAVMSGCNNAGSEQKVFMQDSAESQSESQESPELQPEQSESSAHKENSKESPVESASSVTERSVVSDASSKPESSAESSTEPSPEPSPEPSQEPSPEPSPEPSTEPSPEPSPEPSQEPSPQEIEVQALQNYASTMPTEGEIYTSYDNEYSKTWKINKSEIADYNNDGSYELVIQYYCGVYRNTNGYIIDNNKQGIALKIVKYINGVYMEYPGFKDFADFIRTAGADVCPYAESEITQELYVDESGNLGILTSKFSRGARHSLCYIKQAIINNNLQYVDGFGVTKWDEHGTYGIGHEPIDHYFWVSEYNTYDCLFDFYLVNDISISSDYNIKLSIDEIKEKMSSIDYLSKSGNFVITGESLPLSERSSFMSDLFDHIFYQ